MRNRIISDGSFTSLSFGQIAYKKGHIEQQTHFTSLADPPDIIFAKKVNDQASKVSKQD